MKLVEKIRFVLSTICFLSFVIGAGVGVDALMWVWFITYPVVTVWWFLKPLRRVA